MKRDHNLAPRCTYPCQAGSSLIHESLRQLQGQIWDLTTRDYRLEGLKESLCLVMRRLPDKMGRLHNHAGHTSLRQGRLQPTSGITHPAHRHVTPLNPPADGLAERRGAGHEARQGIGFHRKRSRHFTGCLKEPAYSPTHDQPELVLLKGGTESSEGWSG